ncbi:broad specificity phosphatase PhoE [Mycetocola sp. CAN_C7]|uniref:histidine phosphatase family protein n=1 Tax=Mycetocola sp. CAN_C7 TaxID=2787724 RepID=UPI0018CB1881
MTTTELWLVRHGESTANVLATNAQRDGLDVIPVQHRDADVPLSDDGVRQAEALGAWLTGDSTGSAPSTIWSSPYLRARQTLTVALAAGNSERPFFVDERLRDRELGILDTLTSIGVDRRFPDEAARRRWLGKFYYRPPGGEAWTDVALRIRSFLRDLESTDASGPVLVTAHDAIVLVFLYICLGWSEKELLDFAAAHTVSNASITRLTRRDGEQFWTLDTFASDDHLEALGAPVTEHAGDTDAQPR